MSNLILRHALSRIRDYRQEMVWEPVDLIDALDEVTTAASRVLTGEPVEWCEAHGVPQQTTYVADYKGEYECAEAPYSEAPCHIASKLLIETEKETP